MARTSFRLLQRPDVRCSRVRSHRAGGFADPREGGFSLLELLLTLAIFGIITAGLFTVFDNSAQLARSQTQVSFLQQGQRVGQAELVRYTRAAGLGGLPITRINLPDLDNSGVGDWLETVDAASYNNVGLFPEDGYAISIRNRVTGPTRIDQVEAPSPAVCNPVSRNDCVLPGSDVLIVRGVFSTPIYYFEPPIDISGWVTDGALDQEQVTVVGKIRPTGRHWQDYPQDLEPIVEALENAKNNNRPEAVILRDTTNPNAYLVMEFDHTDATLASLVEAKCTNTGLPLNDDSNPNCFTFPLQLDPLTAPGDDYVDLTTGSILNGSPGTALVVGAAGPDEDDVRLPQTIGSLGILEEYRFFVRIAWEPQPFGPDRLTPVLSRQRFLPGTNLSIGSIVDISENVLDLQIAVGIENDAFGTVPGYGQILDDGTINDEVLFNAAGDFNTSGNYAAPPGTAAAWYDPDLEYYFLRINTLVESAEPERGYLAPELTTIEDHDRGAAFATGGSLPDVEPAVQYNSDDRRRYRRRWLQTVVELRNLL